MAANPEAMSALKQALENIELTEDGEAYGEGGYTPYTAARDAEHIAEDLVAALDALGYKLVSK